jgi:hypothetical protein
LLSIVPHSSKNCYNQGNNAEEIARRLNHLNITQIYAALTYYHANREEIERDIAAEQTAYQELAKQHYQKKQLIE